MSAGPISTALFLVLVASLVVFFSVMAWRTGGRAGLLRALLVQAVVLGATLALAASGILGRFDGLPPPMMVLMVVLVASTILVARSRAGAALASMPLAALAGFQVFRLPLELLLHDWYGQGVLPVQMTYAGRNLDILTGLLAIPVALAAWRGRAPRPLLWVFNVVGLGLLINIVGVAIASFPGPLRVFMNEPANRLVTQAPYIWLPAYLVQSALLGHLLLFRRLLGHAPAADAALPAWHPSGP